MSSTPEPVDPTRIMGKLECLKEIRCRTVQMEKMKTRLKQSIERTESEERCLEEYRLEINKAYLFDTHKCQFGFFFFGGNSLYFKRRKNIGIYCG